MTFTVLDCEMTGLDPARDEILSIGAVRIRDGRVMMSERFYQVFKPTEAVSPKEVILIHGLGPDEVSRGVPLADALDRLLAFIGDSVVIGHFTALDLRFLNAALATRKERVAQEPRARHAPPVRLVAPADVAVRPALRRRDARGDRPRAGSPALPRAPRVLRRADDRPRVPEAPRRVRGVRRRAVPGAVPRGGNLLIASWPPARRAPEGRPGPRARSARLERPLATRRGLDRKRRRR